MTRAFAFLIVLVIAWVPMQIVALAVPVALTALPVEVGDSTVPRLVPGLLALGSLLGGIVGGAIVGHFTGRTWTAFLLAIPKAALVLEGSLAEADLQGTDQWIAARILALDAYTACTGVGALLGAWLATRPAKQLTTPEGAPMAPVRFLGGTVSFSRTDATVTDYRRFNHVSIHGGGAPGAPVHVSANVTVVHDIWLRTAAGEELHLQSYEAPEEMSLRPGQQVTLIGGHTARGWAYMKLIQWGISRHYPLNGTSWFLRRFRMVGRLALLDLAIVATLVAGIGWLLVRSTSGAVPETPWIHLGVASVVLAFLVSGFRRSVTGRKLDEHMCRAIGAGI